MSSAAAELRANVARRSFTIGAESWSYFDCGAQAAKGSLLPLVVVPGLVGSAAAFADIVLTVGSMPHRCICVDPPPFFTHSEWVVGMKSFLDGVGVREAHFLAADLGGFLVLKLAEEMPGYVASACLLNSFADTSAFVASSVCMSSLFRFFPTFLLQKLVLDSFPKGALLDARTARAVDAMVAVVEQMDQEVLASRLSLLCEGGEVGRLFVPNGHITLVSTPDCCPLLGNGQPELERRLRGARLAQLKGGGDFPHISRADEVALFVMVQLVQLEALRATRGSSLGADDTVTVRRGTAAAGVAR